MSHTVPAENCTGCSACSFCCPQHAITMAEDAEGFLYPRVDQEQCNSCGVCLTVCPPNHSLTSQSLQSPIVYAAWTNDSELLRQSTSGGVFSELARFVIEEGGVVFGAAYDERMTVRHMAVDSWDSLNVLRGSKYVQSDVGETYLEVERLLQAGRAVLFSGTPCQIAGLKASNGKDYDRLVTCDLICHGVPSPKVFRLALGALQRRYDSEVEDFHFREKSFGWLYPTVYIKFRNDKSIYENNIDNHFNRGFLRNTYLRPSCYKCPAKLKGSVADITLGDFWQLLKYSPSMINRQGTSVVLVNTETGRQAIQRIAGHMTLTECPVAFVETDSNLCKSVDPPNDREAFFADLDLLPFEELVQKYIKPRSAVVRWLANIRRVTRCLVEGWSKA